MPYNTADNNVSHDALKNNIDKVWYFLPDSPEGAYIEAALTDTIKEYGNQLGLNPFSYYGPVGPDNSRNSFAAAAGGLKYLEDQMAAENAPWYIKAKNFVFPPNDVYHVVRESVMDELFTAYKEGSFNPQAFYPNVHAAVESKLYGSNSSAWFAGENLSVIVIAVIALGCVIAVLHKIIKSKGSKNRS